MPLTEEDVTLFLTAPVEKDKWVNRRQAKIWMQQIIRRGLDKAMAQWEGELLVVIPLGSDVQGMKYKVVFKDVPEKLLHDVIFPTMSAHGLVKQQTREEADANRLQHEASRNLKASNRRALGDAAKNQELVEKLARLRGEGGTEAAKRKFADCCAGILNRSGKVAASRLSEFCEEAHGDDDKNDES